MKLVYDILEFLLQREVSRLKSDARAEMMNLAKASQLQGRLAHAKDNLDT